MRIVVGIATSKRAKILNEMLELLADQTRPPDRVIICPASLADVDQSFVQKLALPLTVVHGRPGASAQRNAILHDVR